jgi:hypothetical protein
MCDRLPGAVPVTVADQLAGFLVQDTARLRFVAADRRFALLDGSRFARSADAQRAADRIARLVLPEAEPPRHCRGH